MKGSCRNDTVRHIRNNIAGNVLQRVCYVRIHSGDEHSRTWIGQGRAKPLQSVKWKPSSFDQIDRFNEVISPRCGRDSRRRQHLQSFYVQALTILLEFSKYQRTV